MAVTVAPDASCHSRNPSMGKQDDQGTTLIVGYPYYLPSPYLWGPMAYPRF
jgi:hypothetical protein